MTKVSVSKDKDSRMLKVIALLIKQTIDGKLVWQDMYPHGFQTVLGNQSVVVENSLYKSLFQQLSGATLEIRGMDGGVLEKVEPMNGVTGVVTDLLAPRKFSYEVNKAVETLYELVANRKEVAAEVATENLLKALEQHTD